MKRRKLESFAQPADVEKLEAKLRKEIKDINDMRFKKALALRDALRELVDAQIEYSGLVLDAAKLEEEVRGVWVARGSTS
jgi:kynureninase